MGRENHAKEAPAATQGEGDEAALKAENASLQDRLLRAFADAENTRRRAAQSAEAARQRTIADVILELLPILDNLQRAIATASDRVSEPIASVSVTEGVRATIAMLLTALKRFGVRKIETVGAAFDPSLHDAILEQDPSSERPGTIIGVMEDGYMIEDRLLRPARVIVAGRRSHTATNSDAAEPQTASANDTEDGRQ
jgi:molecular chaperone GrpE